MNLKTEVVVFALFAAWVAWQISDSDSAPTEMRGSRGGSKKTDSTVYESVPTPNLAAALPPADRDDYFSRDLFAPPSDTAPLPPLQLILPPIEALPALASPTAYGPGPRAAHLLRTPLALARVPGLFDGDLQGSVDAVLDGGITDPLDMTAEQRAARIEALKRMHDWVVDQGRLKFGQIRNKGRFDLARLNEPVLFVEIDPGTGLEIFPDQDPLALERDRVTEFGLADTPENFIELGSREFELPLGHGDIESVLAFAERCVELRNETPRALEVAEQMYLAVAQASDTDVRAPLGLARCFELGFRFDDAFTAYKEMTAGPFKTEAAPWARLGDLLARFRLFARAEENFQRALTVRSTSWEARWRYGRFLLDRDRVDEALDHLVEASKREPTDGDLRWARVAIRADLGACLLELGRVDEAYGRCEQARNANPGDDRGLAGMYSAAIFQEDAEPVDLTSAGEDGPDASFDLLIALGLQGIHQQEWRIARRYLERAAVADPFRAWMAWRSLSWLAERTGHPEEAYSFIERAYLSEPTDPWTLYQLGRLLAAQNDLPGAMTAFKAALDQDLDFADALIGLARLHQLAGEHEAAERYYERALTVASDQAVVHSLRGYNHFQLGDAGAAGEDFDQAVAMNENLASARIGQAWWFYANGDSGEALTRFGGAIDARRNEPEDDPYRAYAVEAIARIQEHEGKEVWTDRFDRIGSIANDWGLDEGDGVISSLRDGEVWLEGQFDKSGKGRVYQTLPAERFLSIEAMVTIHEGQDTRVNLFVTKEQDGRTGEVRVQSMVSIRRNSGDGNVQAVFIRKGQHDPEVIDLQGQVWPIGQPVLLRIETNGSTTDARMSLFMDDLPLLQRVEVKGMGRSQTPIRLGVSVEGQAGRSAKVSIDDVSVVRRK